MTVAICFKKMKFLQILYLLPILTIFGVKWCNGAGNFAQNHTRYLFEAEPEAKMNAVELAQNQNFLAESHYVTTEDGYIIQLDRVRKTTNTRGAILIVHGVFLTSADFVINLANQSLAFLFANYGMDVWIINLRGNTYSRRHVSLSPDDPKFWEFSIDENALYDVPSVLDYMFDKQGVGKIHLLGYSMGTTVLCAMLSSIDRFNDKIIQYTAMASVVEVRHATTIFQLVAPFTGILKPILEATIGPEFLGRSLVLDFLTSYFCKEGPFCFMLMGALFGFDPTQTNFTRSETVFAHVPGGTSLQNVDHFGQMFRTHELRYYDYGDALENLKRYGTIIPPLYDLTNIKVPVLILYANNDPWANGIDARILQEKIPTCIGVTKVGNSLFSHTDFIYAMEAYKYLKEPLLEPIVNSAT